MESIKLELNNERLKAVCQTLQVIKIEKTNDKALRSGQAIFKEVRNKLYKKYLDKENTAGKFSITLKYYEAYHLEEYLRDWLCLQATCLTTRLVAIVADELNQKLT